jgi:PAS domain S-box-containing protein
MNHPPMVANQKLAFWRWMTVAAVLVIIAANARPWSWAIMLGLPLVGGSLGIQLFSEAAFKRWSSRGYLIGADLVLISLALIGAGALTPVLCAGLFGPVLISLMVNDKQKALLASSVLLGLVAAVAAGGAVTMLRLGLNDLFFLPLCAIAVVHFNMLARKLAPAAVSSTSAEQTNELRALLAITETIGNTLDVSQVMKSIANRVGEMADTDSCSIVLADKSKRNCYVMASKGHPEVHMLELKIDKYPEISRALETCEPVLIEDIDSSPLIEPVREILKAKGYQSLLVVPLVYQEDVLGALILRARNKHAFRDDALRFCQVVAGASANALKNALLFEDIKLESTRNQVSTEKLRRVLDCTPDLILATDTEQLVIESNRGAEDLLDMQAAKLQGRSLWELLGSELQLPVDKNEIWEFEDVSLEGVSGDGVHLHLVSGPLKDGDGEYTGRVWIGRDITKLRRVEKSLAQAERLSSMGEIVAGVAHELNNPLSGVVGYAELLRMNATDKKQVRDLDRIVESAMRCQKIVLKLLGFSRKHRSEKKYQSVNDCIRKVLDLKVYHLRSSRVNPVLELAPDLPCTLFDFHQLEQVVLNLLNNAEQSITSIKREGQVTLRSGVRDGRIFIEVEDTGPGVPESIRERVFDPFFTTKAVGMGTGLGLSVSYGLIEEHGGRLELSDASSGEGALFTIWLPLIDGQLSVEEPAAPPIEVEGNPLHDCRILVVEDEQVILDVFARVLEREGALVTLARDGEEAWKLLCHEEYDLIIADLRMPKLSGQGLYERAAETRPELLRRFVFATGDVARPETVSFLENLPNRFLTKPLQMETVRQVLCQAIES